MERVRELCCLCDLDNCHMQISNFILNSICWSIFPIDWVSFVEKLLVIDTKTDYFFFFFFFFFFSFSFNTTIFFHLVYFHGNLFRSMISVLFILCKFRKRFRLGIIRIGKRQSLPMCFPDCFIRYHMVRY